MTTAPLRLILGLAILLAAYLLLYPGVTKPILHVKTTLDKAELFDMGKQAVINSDRIPKIFLGTTKDILNGIQVRGTVVVSDTSKSIWSASKDFWYDDKHLLAFLIVFFSLFMPALKLLIVALAFLFKRSSIGFKLSKLSGAMGKWSMADVFVMALLIAFLAIQASSGNSELVNTEITLEEGFYYFLGFCLLSILAGMFLTESCPKASVAKAE